MKRTRHNRRRVPIRKAGNTLTDIKVFAALSLARREHLSLEHAAKIEGTTVSTIRRRAPSAVEKRGGKYRVKQFDRVPALMNVVGPKGEQTVVVRSSRSRSKIGRYPNAVKVFVHRGDKSALAEFEGKSVAGHRLITNTSKLKKLADAGLLSLNRLYAGLTRGR